MIGNHVELGRVVTFMKYLASAVSLTFLTKTEIENKLIFQHQIR